MDKKEAKSLLGEKLTELKSRPYSELKQLIKNPICFEVRATSGKMYQIEWEAFWDSEPNGDLKIIAAIDDGKLLSSIVPVCSAFVVTPEGKVLD